MYINSSGALAVLVASFLGQSIARAELVWAKPLLERTVYADVGKVAIRFEASNIGENIVHISKISESCSCTEIKSSNNNIQALSTVSLDGWYYTPMRAGRYEESIWVTTLSGNSYSNDTELKIVFTVNAVVEVVPRVLTWTLLHVKESRTCEVLFPRCDGPEVLTLCKVTPGLFASVEVLVPHRRFIVHVDASQLVNPYLGNISFNERLANGAQIPALLIAVVK
jgi:hypothetical protein